jgi:HK97 family phage major capsid protein
MEIDQLIGTQETRFLQLEAQTEQEKLTFSFSSEYAAKREWGIEILSHDRSAVDLSYLNSGVACLFWHHDPNIVLGKVERGWLENRRGCAEIRWSSDPEAQKRKAQVDEGIITGISCRYEILDAKPLPQNQGILITKWKILELTLTPMPVDPTVGIGRSLESPLKTSKSTMGQSYAGATMDETELQALKDSAKQEERDRITGIRFWGERAKQPKMAEDLIAKGMSLEEARSKFLEVITSAPQLPLGGSVNPVQPLGLSDQEQKKYSLCRAILAASSGDWSDAGFELECSKELQKRSGKSTGGFLLPTDLHIDQRQAQRAREGMRATYAVGAPATGGNLVELSLLSENFIDILRNKAMVLQAGARMLSGLVGNVDIPRRNAATTAYWVAENANITQSEATFDLVSMRPKTVGALSAATRLMLLQATPDIEMLMRDDIATVIALEIDRAAIAGSGAAGQPLGILNTVGIGAVVGGVNGAAITIDNMIDLEREIAIDNADMGALNYMVNAKTVAALKKLKATSGEYLWSTDPIAGRSGTPGSINGYPVLRTNQVPGNLTKGTSVGIASALIFGNWNDLLIGEWGVLEILPNPYGTGYAAGTIQIRAMQTLDIQVRHPESFAAMVDALT